MTRRPSTAAVDLVAEHSGEYVTSPTPTTLRIPATPYLSVSGTSRPGSTEFQSGVGALYAVAYTLKFDQKAEGSDFKVPMLEGLYTGLRGRLKFTGKPRAMRWTLMVRVPEKIRAADVRAAAAKAFDRRGNPTIREVRLARRREGTCVQVLHVGPYQDETVTVASMEAYARDQGLALVGPHHEIYLSDPRRVPAARLRTILRCPARRARSTASGRRRLNR